MAIVLSYGCRQEENVSEERPFYGFHQAITDYLEDTTGQIPSPTSHQTHPEPLRVGAQLPESWRTHPLAEALTAAEIALCRTIAEEARTEQRVDTAIVELEEARQALACLRARRAMDGMDVDRAREALTAAMAEGEASWTEQS